MNIPNELIAVLLTALCGGVAWMIKQLHAISELLHSHDKRITIIEHDHEETCHLVKVKQ